MSRDVEPQFVLTDSELDVWASQNFVSLEEGVMLLIGASPRHSLSSEFARSRTQKFYEFSLGLIERECLGMEKAHRQVSPVRFLEMAEKCKVPVPEPVKEAILNNQRTEPAQSDDSSRKPLAVSKPEEAMHDPRVINTLYKIIFALAVEKYRYEPDSPRSEVPAKIEAAMNRQGFTLSAKTIRTHLRAAAEAANRRK